jgi:hypothetical protein
MLLTRTLSPYRVIRVILGLSQQLMIGGWQTIYQTRKVVSERNGEKT